MHSREVQQKSFLLLLIVVSLAFGWILWPFYGAVFWAIVLAILFGPLYRRLLGAIGQRRNLASLLTLLLCLLIVILPMTLITFSLLQEVSAILGKIRSNQIDFGVYFQQAISALPSWAVEILDRFELNNLSALQAKLSTSAAQASQLIAARAFNVGQNMFAFLINFAIMLYLLFFLLRDGPQLSMRIKQAIPLTAEHKQQLASRFATVIRATVKSNITIAVVQGVLGGGIFWFLGIQGALLWGTLMAFLSLLPAVGVSLVWGPVAVYFLLIGAVWQGVLLILFGIFVIGLVDNLLRPILVGKDIKMPDYLVLISTVGGMALVGINGFVIGPVIAALFISVWDLFVSDPVLDRS